MAERLNKGGERGSRGVLPVGDAARIWRPMLDMVRLHLRLHPGHSAARQMIVQMKLGLERAVSVQDSDYEVVRQLAEILEQDTLAVAVGRGGAVAANRDPILALHQVGRIDAAGLRAAREILQVAEMMRDGGVMGLRAMDTTALRVDGGGAGGADMLTYTSRHPALDLVRGWVMGLDAAGQVWPEPAGRFRPHGEVVLAVVVDRQGCRAVERQLATRNGAVAKAVGAALAAYAAAAAPEWARADKAAADAEKTKCLFGDS